MPADEGSGEELAGPGEPEWRRVLRLIQRSRRGQNATIDLFHAYLLRLRTQPGGGLSTLGGAHLPPQPSRRTLMPPLGW